jgi:uncharacterized RDD family membrane protein YckC
MNIAADELEHAGFWPRFGACVIDGLVLGCAFWALVLSARALGEPMLGFIIFMLFSHAVWAYNTFQHGRWGQTIGKRATGIRVVEAITGAPISYARATARDCVIIADANVRLMLGTASILSHEYLFGTPQGRAVDVIFIAWWVVSSLVLVSHRRNRTLHDFIAGTLVIKDGASARRTEGELQRLAPMEIPRSSLSRGF